MNDFKDFGIKVTLKSFVGDKIKMSKILGKRVTIIGYKIGDSKYLDKGSRKCLHMQIELSGVKHVVFTGSTYLMDVIERIAKDKFPFSTIIMEENEGFYEFT